VPGARVLLAITEKSKRNLKNIIDI
jgi:hypothetical protein